MTEPGAGWDLAGMKTQLKDEGDHFLLNGSKTYISNGINADLIITAAKMQGSENRHEMTLVMVERGMEGIERRRNLKKMGLKAQDTAELFFNDVKIPKENILGEVGKGFYYLMEGLAEERLIGAVGYLANARNSFDITRDYVMERKAFGKRICDMHNTQFQMAQMDAELEMNEVYIDHLVAAHSRGEFTSNQAAKAKLLCSELERVV